LGFTLEGFEVAFAYEFAFENPLPSTYR